MRTADSAPGSSTDGTVGAPPAHRSLAVARFLGRLAADAGAEAEPVIAETLEAIGHGEPERLDTLTPELDLLFASWEAEAATLPPLHQIDRRRDGETLARIQQASARGILRKALQQAVSADPVAAIYGVLQTLDRHLQPERYAEVMRLLRSELR